MISLYCSIILTKISFTKKKENQYFELFSTVNIFGEFSLHFIFIFLVITIIDTMCYLTP